MADFSGHSQFVGPVAKTYDYRWGKVGQGKLCRGPDSRAAALPGDFKPGVAGFPEGGSWKYIYLAATPGGARATAAVLGRADWINDGCRVSTPGQH